MKLDGFCPRVNMVIDVMNKRNIFGFGELFDSGEGIFRQSLLQYI